MFTEQRTIGNKDTVHCVTTSNRQRERECEKAINGVSVHNSSSNRPTVIVTRMCKNVGSFVLLLRFVPLCRTTMMMLDALSERVVDG